MKIAICGMPASGKSTFGHLLANKLKVDHFDLDQVIEESTHLSISELFQNEGEFRKIEQDSLNQFLSSHSDSSYVFSLGGGTLQNQQIVDYIKKHCILIYLEASIEDLVGNLEEDSNAESRPMFSNINREKQSVLMDKLLKARRANYEQSHIITAFQAIHKLDLLTNRVELFTK